MIVSDVSSNISTLSIGVLILVLCTDSDFRFELESFFTGLFLHKPIKHIEKNKASKKTKKGEMGSSHWVRAMSNINFNPFFDD